jgi:pre-mRNA-splicing helicase BRR2
VDVEDIQPHLEHVKNDTLKECLSKGVAFYHQGMTDRERAVVENLFKIEAVQVVVVEYGESH